MIDINYVRKYIKLFDFPNYYSTIYVNVRIIEIFYVYMSTLTILMNVNVTWRYLFNTSNPPKDVAHEYSIIRYGYLFSHHCCSKINWCCGVGDDFTNLLNTHKHNFKMRFQWKITEYWVLKGWVSVWVCHCTSNLIRLII